MHSSHKPLNLLNKTFCIPKNHEQNHDKCVTSDPECIKKCVDIMLNCVSDWKTGIARDVSLRPRVPTGLERFLQVALVLFCPPGLILQHPTACRETSERFMKPMESVIDMSKHRRTNKMSLSKLRSKDFELWLWISFISLKWNVFQLSSPSGIHFFILQSVHNSRR